ncbi:MULTISPECIES: hypothetical protein [Rhodococcus]|nr:hypothetical protein [Rhodococcus pyridinivorans]MCD2116746.1 hypothetical protein [Rhodococcus pyridinivorans]MCZ4626046.1 hypothetical protein [Rhodococcus pyridinivorans]MCZ4647001.1 hypothetical protein [Rhodococcus pyridinivorans]MDJ0484242.1 hypothetical protein [Rhodococcus pyridinivorans]MDV7253105.1 hypothetical protein [Rhodococcus pyridinivorans]
MDRLEALDIPVTAELDADGTHSWGYWEDDPRKAWPILAESMGAEA